MRLLLIEDNLRLAKFVQKGIAQRGLESDAAHTAKDGIAAFRALDYDLIILDLGLPDKDGLELLKEMRGLNKNVPIIILTARDALESRLEGLNGGADDYVLKPFNIDELAARIRVLLRRPGLSLGDILEAGNLSLNTLTRKVDIGGETLQLTAREVDLLEQLLRSPGQPVAKETIEARLYGYGRSGSANSVEVLMHRLRQKLSDARADVQIHTLRGLCYLLAEPDAKVKP
ncbi:MAG: response regulator transcription factor [Alphaproteobacteria bacterium]